MKNKDKKMIDEISHQLQEWCDKDDERAVFCTITDGKVVKQIVFGTGIQISNSLINMMQGTPEIQQLLSATLIRYHNENKHSRDN